MTMSTKYNSVSDAVIAASLVGFMTGVFFLALDYVLLSAILRMLEHWSLVAPGWSAAHVTEKEIAAFALAAGPAAIVSWLIYRSARRSKDTL